jgi:hypothetical protein
VDRLDKVMDPNSTSLYIIPMHHSLILQAK